MMKQAIKKNLPLIITLAISALGAIITVILMDFTNIGIPTLRNVSGVGLIDSSFYYSADGLYEYLGKLNSQTTHTLIVIHAIDYVFMICVAVFEISLALLISKKDFKGYLIMPFAMLELLFDISENVAVDIVVKKLPQTGSVIAKLCGGLTLSKWLFTIFYIVSAVLLLVLAGFKYFTNKKKLQAAGGENQLDSSVDDGTNSVNTHKQQDQQIIDKDDIKMI